MKIGRYLTLLVYFLVLVCISIALKEDESESEDEPTHIVVPRSIRFFSRGPEPDDPIYMGPRVGKHLNNVVQGGTVGLEFDVKKGMGRFGPLWDKIRKFLPKYRGQKRPDFVPADDGDDEDNTIKDADDEDNTVKDAEILDPVGRGFINPRLKPSSAKEEMEWERV